MNYVETIHYIGGKKMNDMWFWTIVVVTIGFCCCISSICDYFTNKAKYKYDYLKLLKEKEGKRKENDN